MAQTIKLRRASGTNSAGKVPTTAQLDLGEIAINTYDGRVFIKQSGSGDDENIRHIITTDSETTGSINLIGNITASGNISASGNLFASLSDANGSYNNTVMYDTTSGQFYYTGSYGGGGSSDGYIGDAQSHTAGGSLNMNGNSIISASAIFAQGAITASVTGSTNPSNFLPTTVGGTYSPPTYEGGGSGAIIATADVDLNDWIPDGLPVGTGNFQNQPFQIYLPDRLPGTDLKILSISASGDIDGNQANEYFFNLTLGNSDILVNNFGSDSNANENDLDVFVPVWEYGNSDTDAINGNANFHTVNVDNNAGFITNTVGSLFSDDGQQVIGRISVYPFNVSSLKLRFEIEYVTDGIPTLKNNGDFGKGLAVGDLPNNYASLVYNISRDATIDSDPQDVPKGLAITLGQTTGSAPTVNTSYIDIFSAQTPTANGSVGMTNLASLQPIVIDGLLSGGITWTNISDKRLKENITYSDKGLNEIKKIKVREFNFKGFKPNTTGFIAQELNQVIPEAVVKGNDDNPWMVSETKLIPYLVKAIQEQQKLIEDLQNQINTLLIK